MRFAQIVTTNPNHPSAFITTGEHN